MSAELPLRAAHELPEVVAGDVLHDLAARARDRSVTEHERDAEDEVAGCPEAVGERAGQAPRQARADRRISGRVERETLPAPARAAACSADRRIPASTVHVRSPASCSRTRSRPAVERSSPIRSGRRSALAAESIAAASSRVAGRIRNARRARAARADDGGTGPAPRRTVAVSEAPCRGSRDRPDRTRGARARTRRGRARRTSTASRRPCRPRCRARR